MTSFSDGLLDWAFPPRCVLCEMLGADCPCDKCLSAFERIDGSLPLLAPEVTAGFAVYGYKGPAGETVRALKFHRATALSEWMAGEIAGGLCRTGWSCDLAVPVPIHWLRRAVRGFNQAEILAAKLPIPVISGTLRRVRLTAAQAQLDPQRRARNLTGAFRASGVLGKRVLLVDDVVTSGHTARECARALRAAGATDVRILTFAASYPDSTA